MTSDENGKPNRAENGKRIFRAAIRHGPESELILRCVRLRSDAQNDERLARLLDLRLNWEKLVTKARSHGVLTLLHRKLDQLGWSGVPSDDRRELDHSVRRIAARNLAMAAELSQIVKDFDDHDIRVIAVKGPLFARQVYGNIADRVSSDLDLLVRRDDVEIAVDLLGERGYYSTLRVAEHYEQTYLRWINQIPLADPTRPWQIEVHTSLLAGPDAAPTTFEAFASRLERTEINGQNIDIPKIEEFVLYLCAHGTKHCWERLAWICDIARIIQLDVPLDWAAIQLEARRLDWERAFLLGLTLARDLLGVELPDSVQHCQPAIPELAEDSATRLFDTERQKANGKGPWRLWYQFRSRGQLRHRVGALWTTTMRPTLNEWRAVYLPPALSVLYYPLRFFRLVGKTVRERLDPTREEVM